MGIPVHIPTAVTGVVCTGTITILFSEPIGATRHLQLLLVNPTDSSQTVPIFDCTYTKAKPQLSITAVQQPTDSKFFSSAIPPPPVAQGTFSTSTSKIQATYFGQPLTLKRHDPTSSAHNFSLPPILPDAKWKEDGFLSSNLKLVDCNGTVIARYKRKVAHPTQPQGEKTSAIEIEIANPGRELLDAIIVTGVIAATYRVKSDQGWDKIGEVFEEILG